jgi:hypothetical protein
MRFKIGKHDFKLTYRAIVTAAVASAALALLLVYLAFFMPEPERAPAIAISETEAPSAAPTLMPMPERPPLPTESPKQGGNATDAPAGNVENDPAVPTVASRLTGLPIRESAANNRPVAVVINNIHAALPQSGVSQADIIYEVLAEGDITRLVGIFQDYTGLTKLGPVRSARDYFVDFALDHDAIFIHHGGSPSGYAKLRSLRISRLDGMTYEGVYFRRERTYPDWYEPRAGTTRPLVHSSYTGGDRIAEAAEKLQIRTTLYEDAPFGYTFFSDDKVPVHLFRDKAETITVPFSRNYTRKFYYDPDTKLYNVEGRDGAHMDAEDNTQAAVRNVLIQEVKSYVIAGDEEGRRSVGTVGHGGGYVAMDGVYRPISWSKDSADKPTRWFFADGSELRLAAGRTWICVFQDSGEAVFE